MAYPRFRRAKAHKYVTLTSGSLSIATTAWTLTSASLDMTLNAQVGDNIEYGVNCMWGSEPSIGEMDVFISASGRRTSGATRGYGGWSGQGSVYSSVGGPVVFPVAATDLTSGQITMRLYYRILTGTTAKSLFAHDASYPLHVWVKNLGPADPT